MPNELSTNLIQTLIDHNGFVPSSGGFRKIPLGTIADEVEAAIAAEKERGIS